MTADPENFERRDFETETLGRRLRSPRGVIAICRVCKRPGLARIYAARRGRYQVSWWHGAKRRPGEDLWLADGLLHSVNETVKLAWLAELLEERGGR